MTGEVTDSDFDPGPDLLRQAEEEDQVDTTIPGGVRKEVMAGKMKVVRLLVIEGDERWVRQTLDRSEVSPNHPLLIDSNTGLKSIIETERKVLTAEQWHLPIHILLGE